MSNTESNQPIVVGVDGSQDSLRAVDWAAAEADRHGWPMKLVHAYQRAVAALPAVSVELPAPVEQATKYLSEARDRVVAKHPSVSVTVIHQEGQTPRVLLEESEDARLLVVGREGLNRMTELVLGSVSLACATHSKTPVAVIPAAWDAPAEPYRRIVVGIDGSANCEGAVRYAFETAAEHGAELVVVRAWGLPTRWSEGWPSELNKASIEAEIDSELAEWLSSWRDKYQDVAMRAVSVYAQPAAALAKYAAEADQVVIGGRGHGAVTGALLGSQARTILRHVAAPMVVVHQA
jgi:nucleotide-binding universal stress UspA family protein